MMSPIARSNCILYCVYFAETVHFYREGFGFAVTHERDWFVEFELSPDAFLSVANECRATVKSAGGKGLTLSWQIPVLEHAWAELRARGLDPGPIRVHAWGARVCHLRDPEGNRIELWTPAPGEC
jgi:catechol 2,3-dioxygenase-like lactoylglutathione lyase family enzyme